MQTLDADHGRGPLGAEEQRFLLSVLDVHAPVRAPEGALDWAAIMRVASECKVLPLLADRALAGCEERLEPAVADRLRESLHETAVYNTRLRGELSRAVSVLSSAAVDHVVLKGAVLMHSHYPRPVMRHAVDFDLVIDPERFHTGLDALRAAGFADAEPAPAMGPDGEALAASPRTVAHACAPLRGPSGVNVDLHHRVPAAGFERGGFRGWHARARSVEISGVPVRMCDPQDLAVHLCEHFALQNYGDPQDAPRLLADLRALFPECPAWEQLSDGPARQRVAVAVARRLFDAAFGPEPSRDPMAGLLRRVATGDPSVRVPLAQISNLRGHARRIYLDLLHRPGYALRTWFPTRVYLGQRYGVDPSSARIYPLYLTRLMRAAFKPLWPKR
ncbi:MAG: nucleotidyltransferase family protein [Myxococcales bacterium]|nr:nucleotidyltransferase family protein [Myxococcales bacterium]